MKRIIYITIVLAIASVAVYAAVDDKFIDIVEIRNQATDVIKARNIIANVRSEVQNAHADLLEISQSGSFDAIDIEVKQTLLAAWQVIKDANDGFGDPNITLLLDARP